MKSFRENPDGEANQKAERENNVAVEMAKRKQFCLKCGATHYENLGREVLKNGQLTCDVRYWRDIARRLAENGGGLKRYDSLEYADAIEEYKRSAAIYEAQEIANQELAQERGEEAADATETANRGRAV